MKTVSKIALLTFMIVSQNIGQLFIPLTVEHALFRASENQSYLEIYVSFYENNLKYIQQNDRFTAEYLATAEVIQNDSVIDRRFDRRISEIDTSNTPKTIRQFLNLFKFYLAPGSYAVRIQVQDQHSTGNGEYVFDLTVPPFSSDHLTMSSIQLCSKINSTSGENEFEKNSFITVPNPENLFSISQPVLYYYAELYNLQYDTAHPGTYVIHTTITDLQGNIVKDYPVKSYKKPGSSAVVVGGYNIVTLSPADYYLNMEIIDEQTQATVRGLKKFSFYKPTERDLQTTDSAFASSRAPLGENEYLGYSEKELDKEFAQAEYISTKEERQTYKNLNLEGKRIFLAKFWKKHDSNPQTEVNEFRKQYLELVSYANQNYGAMRKEGWKTDRGRVLLTYGTPNEIERYYMEIDKKPYEIWHYQQLEGGVIFVFADISGFGEFDLLHSTFSRELQQPNWERLVAKTPGSLKDDQQF